MNRLNAQFAEIQKMQDSLQSMLEQNAKATETLITSMQSTSSISVDDITAAVRSAREKEK